MDRTKRLWLNAMPENFDIDNHIYHICNSVVTIT
jgi:hypothetical protein